MGAVGGFLFFGIGEGLFLSLNKSGVMFSNRDFASLPTTFSACRFRHHYFAQTWSTVFKRFHCI